MLPIFALYLYQNVTSYTKLFQSASSKNHSETDHAKKRKYFNLHYLLITLPRKIFQLEGLLDCIEQGAFVSVQLMERVIGTKRDVFISVKLHKNTSELSMPSVNRNINQSTFF